jgi:hypothetical protein
MYTYRKQVSPNSTTPASTAGYVIYSLDLNSIATYNMADVEVIASLSITSDPNISTIYYRKLQLVSDALNPIYTYPPKNSSFNYAADVGINLYLSEISYVQSGGGANNGNIQIKTTNPTGTSKTGICFVHFKINFY